MLLSWASYKRSFALTFNGINQLEELDNNLEGAKQAEDQALLLQVEIDQLNKLIGNEVLREDLVQQSILDEVNTLADSIGVSINSISQIHEYQGSDYTIYSNLLVVEGRYTDIADLIYNIERNYKGSRIGSMNYYKKYDRRNKTEKLYAKIIFQNYSRG